MQRLIAILLLALAWGARAAAPTGIEVGLLTDTNGLLKRPTNFFGANTQAMMRAIEPHLAGGGISAATATNIIAAMAPVTFATIADMIAGFTTNLCYVKAHHGANGLGGGWFEARHTNGFATNELTIFATPVPKKFAFRLDPSPLNPEWAGAVHDVNTDDTVPLQRWLNMLTNGNASVSSPWTSLATMPPGVYRYTQPLVLTNHQPGTSFKISGQGSVGRGPDGARLYYDGAVGGTMMYVVGANASTIENVAFDANSKAKFGLVIDSENIEKPGSPGSSNFQLRDSIIGATIGAGSVAVVIGHDTGGDTPQISEVAFWNVYFSGASGSDIAVKNMMGGNIKNFFFYNCKRTGFTNDLNLFGCNTVIIDNMIGGNSMTNIIAQNLILVIKGWQDEGSSNFVNLLSAGANAAEADISGVDWNGAALPGSDDTIMRVQGSLNLRSSTFRNSRTPTSPPNVVFTPAGANAPGSIVSMGNYYRNATVPPIYGDGSSLGAGNTNNWIFHSFDFSQASGGGYGNFANTNWSVTSFGDFGGTEGAIVRFKSYSHGGGNVLADYLHVLGSGVWYSNKLGAGTLTPTNGFDSATSFGARGTNNFFPDINSNTNDAGAVASLRVNAGGKLSVGPLSGSGDFVGPGSATDNAVVRYDGTTGKLAQNSGVIISDTTNVTGVQSITANASLIGNDLHSASGDLNIYAGSGAELKLGANGNAAMWHIYTDGNLYPWSGNAHDIGSPASVFNLPVRNVYAVNLYASLPTNTFLVSAPGGIIATGIIGSGLSYDAATRTLSASGGSGTPNGPFGAIQWGETSILRGTNSLLWTNDTLILNNPDTTGSRYFYWSFGSLTVPAFSIQATTNLWTMQSDTATSGPRFIQARKDDRSISFNGNSITNNANVYNNSNVVNAGSVENRSVVTNAAAVNSAGPVTNWNQVVGMSQFPGQPSTDSYSSTNQNGKLFTLQSALIATNMTLIWPTNGWNGLTAPIFFAVSNIVGDANGTTGQVTFVQSADLATMIWANAISNYVNTAASNRVAVAVTGPAFATVAPTGSGGVETFTLTASAALGNWQGLTSHAYTNLTIVNLANNPYVAYTNITPLLTNTFWVDAGGMRTNGGSTAEGGRTTAAPSVFDSGTSNFDVFDFDDTTNECANFSVAMGPSFAGLVQVSLHWLSTNTLNPGLTNVVFEVAASPVNTNGVLSGYTWQTNLTTRFWSSNALQIATMPVMTLTGHNPRNLIKFRVGRIGTNTSDAVVGDVRLLGAEVSYVSTNAMGGF